jgi:tetratricopeptide (TPR) repeat protein/transglutaminase-like putative cysteine protease
LRHSWYSSQFLRFALLLLLALPASAGDVFSAPAFSVDGAALRQAADQVKPGKSAEATVLLNELHFSFDTDGKVAETRHFIYRIETQEGVENWAETSGRWNAWHQSKPEIKARVVTIDGAVHWIDPKTLADYPVHKDAPDLYTDERRYGGPLPAVAIGAIVEEEIIRRDTTPLFAAGTVIDWGLGWSVPVNRTHIVIIHPDSLPLQYRVHLLPDATINKSDQNGLETITLDHGPLPAYVELPDYTPPDLFLAPDIEFSTGTSWQHVASEYARLTNEKVRTADVQPLLATINLKDGKRDDIIRRLVATLHKNVRYTGVEFGESSLIPQFPSETLKRKYGDCKDKATLLVAMLRAVNIPAKLALLDAGPGLDVNPELPGMGAFDHAIVYVPASGADPDLWIDATAQYSQAGTLPWMDYSRWALIVDDTTQSLKQTPQLTADHNVQLELRDFALAEYGNAAITEIDEVTGPAEADYRQYYIDDSKQVRDNSESYVKDMYLADSLTSLNHGDLSNLEEPSSIKFVAKGRRGNTYLTSAVMAIRVEYLFDRLPKYFRTAENKKGSKEESPDTNSSDDAKPRTADWWINPFTTEWQYKITAPLGFKLRALPSDKNEKVGVLNFSEKYSVNAEGTVVNAVLRVENPATRLTPEQAINLRDAVVVARNSDPILITFDHVGQTLIAAGKIKEGLAAYRQVAAQHPKEALHQVQLAQALLTAGLGEEARVVAREATVLEPKSALAFSTLGTVLKNDQIGRAVKKGMDYDGAVDAYKKSLAIDPKDKETLANLALLLEYDAAGVRYAADAPLEEAAAKLRELKNLDEDYARSYDDNVVFDLWYAHDYKGVLDSVAALPANDTRKGLTLAALAVLQGTDAALKKSLEITTDDQSRSQVLVNAGNLLSRVRKYPEAAALLTEGARGQANGSQFLRSAAIFAKTKPYEEIKMDPSDPRAVVQQVFGEMLSGQLTFERALPLMYVSPEESDEILDRKQFDQMMSTLRAQIGDALPLISVADLAVSNMRYTVDGDDSVGYKIIVESPGAAPQSMFVLRDENRYKIAAFSTTSSVQAEQLAPLALREIEKGNLVAARKWLDRARDQIHIDNGDDPLSGALFPFFWTKGQEADASAVQTAALVLLPSKHLKDRNLATIIAARDKTKDDLQRARLNLVLDYAYSTQQRWQETLPVTSELVKNYPSSLRAFRLAETTYGELKRFDDWDSLINTHLQSNPDEPAYIRSQARLAAYRGDFPKAREILKSLIDKGRAISEDFNEYAWFALELPGPIDQETIDVAVRGNDLTKNSSFAILHTLACVYAQDGKTSEARELLLKAMDASHLEEPNTEIWFGFGLIAEQYGITDAAEKMFGLIEKPKDNYPASTYGLAQQHLAALHRLPKEPAKSQGQ